MKKVENYKDYIKYRSSWMGVAIILIIMFHVGSLGTPIIKYFTALGYGGVDIFFFASGIGCCYSLKKNSDIYQYLKKRFYRIYPIYIPVAIIFLFIRYLFEQEVKFVEILGNLFCLGSYFGLNNQFDWYLGAQMVFLHYVSFYVVVY